MKTFEELKKLVGEERAILIAWETLPEEFITEASVKQLGILYDIDCRYNNGSYSDLSRKIFATRVNGISTREKADMATCLLHHNTGISSMFNALLESIADNNSSTYRSTSLSDWDYIYRLSKHKDWASARLTISYHRDFSDLILNYIRQEVSQETNLEILLGLLSQPDEFVILSGIYIDHVKSLLKQPA